MKLLLRTVRRWVLAPILWWARDHEGDALDQSAWARGRADARRAAADGRLFGLCTAVLTVAVPIGVGTATGSLAAVPRALLTIVAVVVGYLLVPTGWAVVATITAPVRQRDELRARLTGISGGDLLALAHQFSAWLATVRASFPAEPSLPYAAVFEQRGGPARADYDIRKARHADACAEALRLARLAYHKQFREHVVRVLGPASPLAIDDPNTLDDLQAIGDALAGSGGQQQVEFVPASHDQQLRATLKHLQIRRGQQAELDFGDPVGGIKLYGSAFAAHFPQLLARVQEWNEAVRAVTAARSDYASALAAEADKLQIEPPTYDRDTILAVLEELTRPSLHLALEDWSPEGVPVRGYDDGRVEFAGILTKVPPPVAPAHLQKLVAPLVQLCTRARELPQVTTIASTQDALTSLIQPFLDELRLELFVEGVRVASDCPVCQRNAGA
jgi:hypothetical protein